MRQTEKSHDSLIHLPPLTCMPAIPWKPFTEYRKRHVLGPSDTAGHRRHSSRQWQNCMPPQSVESSNLACQNDWLPHKLTLPATVWIWNVPQRLKCTKLSSHCSILLQSQRILGLLASVPHQPQGIQAFSTGCPCNGWCYQAMGTRHHGLKPRKP